jgi:Na+/melibiose symporter-like transporter
MEILQKKSYKKLSVLGFICILLTSFNFSDYFLNYFFKSSSNLLPLLVLMKLFSLINLVGIIIIVSVLLVAKRKEDKIIAWIALGIFVVNIIFYFIFRGL